ncbi:hypothetical protein LC087_05615 [Bacillus carboniphilus]|uniref:serine-type D-Ala-D-Ala carboxypeptidase n=1 Tax=Bacillus carboniphilus TaxID=86663 RepID=A0ABY9JXX4_9BACI|nr:hypothetical protein [Bacillus carboniphilus]WLR43628.1 hypothetical protein LC087_05615 [Bacillus carboniphilus]
MNRGAAILSLIFMLLFLIFFSRFLYIQLTGEINNVSLDEKAAEKYDERIKITGNRGVIYDRNGEVVAGNKTTFTLIAYVDPSRSAGFPNGEEKHVVNTVETASQLAPYLSMDENKVIQQLDQAIEAKKYQIELSKKLSYFTKQQIESLHLKGIDFRENSTRTYPNGVFASHVIGAYSDKEKKGIIGIEESLEEYLTGQDGYQIVERDQLGFLFPNGDIEINEPDNGANVYLTLDYKIQTYLDSAINEAESKEI